MRILQINAVYRQLSTGSNVYELNQAFRAQGHTCVAAYSVGKIENPEEEWLIGSRFGQKMHALLSRVFGLQGYFSPFATRKLLRKMDQFQPDVVVLNNLHANYIHLPMLLKYLAKKDIPTVAVLHDCWFYTGKCCFYSTSGCDKWRTRCENCPAKKKYNKSWFFDFSGKMHKDREELFGAIPRLGVVAVSDWLLTQAIQSPVFVNAKEIVRIHNWIDHKKFTPMEQVTFREKLGLVNKKVLLAVAADWENRKGLDTLLWMAEQLRPDEQLVVIGRVHQSLPETIMHIDRTSSREELIAYYSMADVFVQPSLEETFGKVTAEALACGTPVVCYDSTANPELVGKNCGEIVPAKDKEAMLQQVRKVLSLGKEHYTHFCRAFAEERFNTKRIFDEYMQMFVALQKEDEKERNGMKVLWVVNMVLPDAAEALGVKTSYSGSWLIDPLKKLSETPYVEMATITYGFVDKPQIITVNNVRHYIFPGAGKRLLFNSKKTLVDCRYVLDDFKPDLIHIYGTEYSIGYSMLKLQPSQPVLVTIQGILTYISREYRGGLPACKYHKLFTVREAMRLKLPLFSELLFRKNAKRERWVLAHAKYVSGRTAHDRAFAAASNPKAKYFQINYNLREDFYTAKKWDQETCEPHTIFTGAATYPLKGLHGLLDALALVKMRHPDVKLYVPGNHTTYKAGNGYERYLFRKIRKLGLQDNVVFVGRKSGQEMIQHLQRANVYVLPSSYDTDSLSLCEAQLLGVPVIASMRGGSGELVQDKVSGFCYNYADYPLLAERICQLFEDKALAKTLSENGIRQAECRHAREKNVQKQVELYQYLMQQ